MGCVMQQLHIDGESVVLDSTFSIRWVEQAGGPAFPVLYRYGKRIVKSWKLVLDYDSPEDPFGGNANTN